MNLSKSFCLLFWLSGIILVWKGNVGSDNSTLSFMIWHQLTFCDMKPGCIQYTKRILSNCVVCCRILSKIVISSEEGKYSTIKMQDFLHLIKVEKWACLEEKICCKKLLMKFVDICNRGYTVEKYRLLLENVDSFECII